MDKSQYTIFLDRDGTINVNFSFPNVDAPEKLSLLDGAAQGIKLLNGLNCRVIVITNQAGINNPENPLDWDSFQAVTERMEKLISQEAGALVEDTFVCPHQASENCSCRKPATGLYLAAQKRYPRIDFQHSVVVGDRTDDIAAGAVLGCRTLLVLTGHGQDTQQKLSGGPNEPDMTVPGLLEAAKVIETWITAGSW